MKGNTYWLSGNVVKVDEVANRVDGGEEQGGAGADLVELQARVQRDILRMTMMVIVVIVVMIVVMVVMMVMMAMVMTVQAHWRRSCGTAGLKSSGMY